MSPVRRPEGMEGMTVDLDVLAEWLDDADGLEVDFGRPLEPWQQRLMDTLGVVPR